MSTVRLVPVFGVSTRPTDYARSTRIRRVAKSGSQSNGRAEAFVGTFKRDCVDGAELRGAESVLK